MLMQPRNDPYDDEDTADETPVWPTLLAAGSALVLGYLVGRASYSHDVREAVRQIAESPEPIEVTIETL